MEPVKPYSMHTQLNLEFLFFFDKCAVHASGKRSKCMVWSKKSALLRTKDRPCPGNVHFAPQPTHHTCTHVWQMFSFFECSRAFDCSSNRCVNFLDMKNIYDLYKNFYGNTMVILFRQRFSLEQISLFWTKNCFQFLECRDRRVDNLCNFYNLCSKSKSSALSLPNSPALSPC